MKIDVANVQLKETGKLSYSQFALVAVVLFIATKVCTLPSVIANEAGSKSLWVVLLLFAAECGVLYFAAQTARQGGLFALPIPRGWKIAAAIPLLAFFALKLAAFTREIATYYALSLFESVPVLPIAVILLVFTCLFAHKGFSSLGRSAEVFLWLFVFVFLFIILFTRTQGNLFNALAIVNPDFDKVGSASFQALGWFGDAAVIQLVDLSGANGSAIQKSEPPAKCDPRKKILAAALLVSFLILTVFYTVFTSVYGDAAKMTDYAFIKLSAFKANTDELGSADWPMITLWAIVSCLYLALVLLAGKECAVGAMREMTGKESKGRLAFVLLCLFALALSFFVMDEATDYTAFMTKGMSIATAVAAAVTVAVGVAALSHKKENHEKQN